MNRIERSKETAIIPWWNFYLHDTSNWSCIYKENKEKKMPAGGVLNALNANELQAAAVAELAEDPKQLQVCQGAGGGP